MTCSMATPRADVTKDVMRDAQPITDGDDEFVVLLSQHQECRIQPAALIIPPGWTAIGPTRRRAACIDWIVANSSDMYPFTFEVDGG